MITSAGAICGGSRLNDIATTPARGEGGGAGGNLGDAGTFGYALRRGVKRLLGRASSRAGWLLRMTVCEEHGMISSLGMGTERRFGSGSADEIGSATELFVEAEQAVSHEWTLS